MRVLIIILIFSLNTFGQNILEYNFESQMGAYSPLYTGDSLLFWGFRDLDDKSTTSAILPGPTIICNEGDSVIINMTNPSFEAHTIHLHGLDVDQQNDGVPSTSFFIQPNETGTYSFKATYAGNFLYHCHVGTVLHLQLGMYGAVIVKAANGVNEIYTGGPTFDKEYTWLAHEVDKSWHDDYTQIGPFYNFFPDHFQINAKSKSQIWNDTSISIYNALPGDRILLRLLNIGYGFNRYKFPNGLDATIITSDGRPLPISFNADSIDIYPGERYSVLLNVNQSLNDSVIVEYRKMYRSQLWGIEKIPINSGSLSTIKGIDRDSNIIYPNPTDSNIQLKKITREVKIYDLHGNIVFRVESEKPEIDQINISDLNSGLYIIAIRNAEGKYDIQKLVKK